MLTFGAFWFKLYRDHLQILVRGPDAKRGNFCPLLYKGGALKKKINKFSVKIEVNMLLLYGSGLTRNFHGKKGGGAWNFLRSEGEGAESLFHDNFLASAPLQVFVNGYYNSFPSEVPP